MILDILEVSGTMVNWILWTFRELIFMVDIIWKRIWCIWTLGRLEHLEHHHHLDSGRLVT